MTGFKHRINVQIRYNDIDMAGHVNNAVHMYYYDYGRLHYFNEVFNDQIKWREKGFVVVKQTIEYQKPVYLDDKIDVFTRISLIGSKSIEMLQQVVNQNNEVNSVNSSVLVAFDYQKQVSMELPVKWKDMIMSYEKDVKIKVAQSK